MSSNRPEVRPTTKLGGPDVASQRREDYWSITIRQFKKNRIAVLGVVLILALFVVAVGADFIANDMPLVMSYSGETYFPALQSYGV